MTVVKLSGNAWYKKERIGDGIHVPEFWQLWDMQPRSRSRILVYGRYVETPRKDRVYGEGVYSYSGNLMVATPVPEVLKPLEWYINKYMNTYLYPYNMMLVNWYKNGEEYVSAHQDNEKGIDQSRPIVSVSFGATRKLRIRSKATRKEIATIELKNYDVFTMGGTDFQKLYTHEIVKQSANVVSMPRVSITFRRMFGKNT